MGKKIIMFAALILVFLNQTALMAAKDEKFSWTQITNGDNDLVEIRYYYYDKEKIQSEGGIPKKTLDKDGGVKSSLELGTMIKIVDPITNKSQMYKVIDNAKDDVIYIYCKNRSEYDKRNKILSDRTDDLIKKKILNPDKELAQIEKARISFKTQVYIGKCQKYCKP